MLPQPQKPTPFAPPVPRSSPPAAYRPVRSVDFSHLKGKFIAVDFDGTCVEHAYPDIGKDIGAAPVLRNLVRDGALLMLWTMRSEDGLRSAVDWFERNGIHLFGVQRNPTQDRWTQSPKCYAHIYIDDAALGCPLVRPPNARPYVDWFAVEAMLASLKS